LTLPFGLTELQLAQIASEIRGLDGKQLDEGSLWKAAPQLASFVDRQNTDDSPPSRLLRLEAILHSIDNIMDEGERYMERVKSIYSAYQHLLIPKSDVLEDGDDIEEESELEQLIREQQASSEAERAKRHPRSKVVAPTEHEEQQTQKRFLRIVKQCHVLVSLYFYCQEAKRIYMQFMETRNLMLKAVTLPASEAELFLRYQTTLERRLSSVIGELLELQRRR
jgi:hypothetical protein